MNSQKTLALVLACIATFCLVACSGSRQEDERQIRIAVFKDHVKYRLSDHKFFRQAFPASFLKVASAQETDILAPYFATNFPQVIVICGTNRVVYETDGTYSDRLNGGNACLYEVSIDSIDRSSAKARGEVWFGSTGMESFIYTLIKTNNQWLIVKRESGPMA